MVTCRPLLVGVALSALAVCAAAVTPRDRATAAADSLWATFWSAEEQYLLRDAPAAQSSSSTTTGSLLPYWNFQEATHAVAAAAGLDYAKYGPRLRSMIQGQAVMTPSRQPGTGTGPGPSGADGWTRPGLDEMNWAVLALIAAHDAAEAANDTAAAAMYLNGATNSTARNVMGSPGGRPFPQTVVSGWDAKECGGGIYEDRAGTTKSTASNAGPALSAALLSVRLNYSSPTSGPGMARAYREYAEMVYLHWNETMTNGSTGAVFDRVEVAGCSVSTAGFTHNVALMLGAATTLGHGVDAARFARRLATAQVVPAAPGGSPVLHDGCEARCGDIDCASFKGVAARELSRWLASPLSPLWPKLRARVADVLAGSAAAVWTIARSDGPSGPLFSSQWAAKRTSACGFEAAAQTSAVFALLTQAGAPAPAP